MATKQKQEYHMYKPRYGGSWWYLVKGRSTRLCSIDNVIVASKTGRDISAIAWYLNNVERLENELRQAREVYHALLDTIETYEQAGVQSQAVEVLYTAYDAKLTEVRQCKATFETVLEKCKH